MLSSEARFETEIRQSLPGMRVMVNGEHLRGKLKRLAMEPPIRLLSRLILKRMPIPASTRALWDLSERPAYLLGLNFAARQAIREGVRAFSAVEFGVAGGNGLIVLEKEAAAISRDHDLAISVVGFDRGSGGLPDFIGDHRDHPDIWKPGDFPMDEAALRARLSPTTQLFLGDVAASLPRFLGDQTQPPLGFISFDLDLYSSTSSALMVLSSPAARMLEHVALAFDDVDHARSHRFAGELLAIDEFNERSQRVKIDRWRGLAQNRPFPEAGYLQKMYIAHDLPAIGRSGLARNTLRRDLNQG